jgi:hypothetical protein
MPLTDTFVLTLLAVTTSIAITAAVAAATKKKLELSAVFFALGAVLSWILLFFYLYYLPNTIIVQTPNPLTAEGIEGLLITMMILFEIAGFGFLIRALWK